MKAQVAAATVLLAVLPAGCTVTVDSHSEIVREERRFSVRGRPDLTVGTFDGSIHIQSWEKSDVLVDVEKRGPTKTAVDGIEIRVSQDGDTIELEARRPPRETLSGIGLYRTAYAKLTVWLPRRADVRARTGDGAIEIERLEGTLDVRTSDGRIRATEVAGQLTFSTGDGSITVTDARGRLVADTGDGSVTIAGALDAVRLHTGDGSVVYRATAGSTMADDWEITTGDGSISLFLPPDFNAHLDAYTGDGSIRSDLGVQQRDDDRARRSLRGTMGEGGRLLRVRTGDGTIRLRQH